MSLTLTITIDLHTTEFRMKGLSIKKLGDAGTDLCRDSDTNVYYVYNGLGVIDQRTAAIKKEYLISFLRGFRKKLQFDKIVIKGHYEVTGDELFNEVIKEK